MTTQSVPTLPLPAGTYALDPSHSGVFFQVRHLGLANVRGQFKTLDAERLEDATNDVDLVFDAAGGQVLAQSASIVKPGGTLVSVAAFPPFGREDAREIFFIQASDRAQLIELARLVDEGHLRPQVGGVYPLARAVEAYSAKAAGGIPGRFVLQP